MANNSGSKKEDINFRERVISDDFMRMQAFISADIADLLRYWFESSGSEDNARGYTTNVTADTNPMRALIISGLMGQPLTGGSTNLIISPGAVLMIDLDEPQSPDDSVAKWVVDPGVQTLGQITLTAGDPSQTRIDVLECARTDLVLETDNRDVFNPSTGQFTPTTVNKVERNVLQYRIRLGTPGAGFPGTVAGWLPLMVAIVPATVTIWDDVDCFDVRPLLADLAAGPFSVTDGHFGRPRNSSYVYYDGTFIKIMGGNSLAQSGGFKAGGLLVQNTANMGQPIELNSSLNNYLEPGFTPVPNRPVYVYALFPFSLPRWAEYSSAGLGVRVPESPRGLICLSTKAPGVNGNAISTITLPPRYPLQGASIQGVTLLDAAYDGSSNFLAATTANGLTRIADPGLAITPTGVAFDGFTIALVDGTTHPPDALSVILRISIGILSTVADTGSPTTRTTTVFDSSGTIPIYSEVAAYTEVTPHSLLDWTYTWEQEINLRYDATDSGGISRKVTFFFQTAFGTITDYDNTTPVVNVVGWRKK
jgi:hypothetical protein